MRPTSAGLLRSLAATSLVALALIVILLRSRESIAPVRSSEVELDEPADDTTTPRSAYSSDR